MQGNFKKLIFFNFNNITSKLERENKHNTWTTNPRDYNFGFFLGFFFNFNSIGIF